MGPPTSPVTGFTSPSNSGFAPLRTSGCNSSPLPVAWTRAFTAASSTSSADSAEVGDWFNWGDFCAVSDANAGDWFICGRDLDDGGEEASEALVGLVTTDGRGVLKAPVDDFWRRSNSSCSLAGRRGGEGPFEKAGRVMEVENRRWEGTRKRRDRSRGILYVRSLRIARPSRDEDSNRAEWRILFEIRNDGKFEV